mgnify:CR=1 FL=1
MASGDQTINIDIEPLLHKGLASAMKTFFDQHGVIVERE